MFLVAAAVAVDVTPKTPKEIDKAAAAFDAEVAI